MKRIEETELEKVMGGTNTYITGPIMEAFVSIIDFIYQTGEKVGSAIRRMSEDNMCPLK